jgi:hypothetical protein
MWKWLKREFFGWWSGFRDWVSGMDSCELCGNEKADYVCVGCEKRICCMCESGYYSDESLCMACRHDITPEQEAEDRKDAADDLAGQCVCLNGPYQSTEIKSV